MHTHLKWLPVRIKISEINQIFCSRKINNGRRFFFVTLLNNSVPNKNAWNFYLFFPFLRFTDLSLYYVTLFAWCFRMATFWFDNDAFHMFKKNRSHFRKKIVVFINKISYTLLCIGNYLLYLFAQYIFTY